MSAIVSEPARRARRAALPADRLAWQLDAACRTAGPNTARALQDAAHPEDAEHLAAAWCASCPVRASCAADGVATHGWGVWGGVVLTDGRPAKPRPVQLDVVAQRAADLLASFLARQAGGRWIGTAARLLNLLDVEVPNGSTAGKLLARAALAGVVLVPLQRPPHDRARRVLLALPRR